MNFNNLKELKIGGKDVKELAINGKTVWREKPKAMFILKSINGVNHEFDASNLLINRNLAYTDYSKTVLEPYNSDSELHVYDSVACIEDINGELSSIDVSSFFSCSNLLSANCPNVISIGQRAFYGCTNLSSVNCPNVSLIDVRAFYNCQKLLSLDCNNAVTIGSGAFRSCSKLQTVNCISATLLNDGAFQYCLDLTSIQCQNVSSMANNAFDGCSSLSSISLPNAEFIGGYAFNSCSKLSAIDCLKANLFGRYAFKNCISLSSINCPNISSIGVCTFENCSSLSTIDFGNELTAVPTLVNANAFTGLPSNYMIKVPDALYGDWIQTSPWKDISSYIHPQTPSGFSVKIADNAILHETNLFKSVFDDGISHTWRNDATIPDVKQGDVIATNRIGDFEVTFLMYNLLEWHYESEEPNAHKYEGMHSVVIPMTENVIIDIAVGEF